VRFRDQFTTTSKLKLLAWCLGIAISRLRPFRKFKDALKLEVSLVRLDGDRLFLRNHDDYGVAYEVYLKGLYDISCPGARLVLDLGGHAGFTALYLARRFPDAKIVVLEPDHERADQTRKHIRANRLQPRVELIEAAAGTRTGVARLSVAGSSSRLGTEGQEVHVVDIFQLLEAHPVDVLKMDIEGGEYELLADPRFEGFAPAVIAMEWHETSKHEDGHLWCMERLAQLGYRIHKEFPEVPWAGNLIAIREVLINFVR
jgi:FkbM family methyltransferase